MYYLSSDRKNAIESDSNDIVPMHLHSCGLNSILLNLEHILKAYLYSYRPWCEWDLRFGVSVITSHCFRPLTFAIVGFHKTT